MLPLPLSAFKKLDIMAKETKFDVLIIGGSYASLSAAMALGRSLRNVLIIDAGSPCNEQTPTSLHKMVRPQYLFQQKQKNRF